MFWLRENFIDFGVLGVVLSDRTEAKAVIKQNFVKSSIKPPGGLFNFGPLRGAY